MSIASEYTNRINSRAPQALELVQSAMIVATSITTEDNILTITFADDSILIIRSVITATWKDSQHAN